MKAHMEKCVQKVLGFLNLQLMRKGPTAFEVQKKFIKKTKPVIFDVGANIGSVTKLYNKIFPKASIYSFEPYPAAYEQLQFFFMRNKYVKVQNLAISEKKGCVLMNANISAATNSLHSTALEASFYWGENLLDTKEKIKVDATTIDSFCVENRISKIDILKLDIQGHELAALHGAKEMLKKNAISVIYSEIIMVPTYSGQNKFHEYLSFLDSLGYELFDMYNLIRSEEQFQLIQADVIFINKVFYKSFLQGLE